MSDGCSLGPPSPRWADVRPAGPAAGQGVADAHPRPGPLHQSTWHDHPAASAAAHRARRRCSATRGGARDPRHRRACAARPGDVPAPRKRCAPPAADGYRRRQAADRLTMRMASRPCQDAWFATKAARRLTKNKASAGARAPARPRADHPPTYPHIVWISADSLGSSRVRRHEKKRASRIDKRTRAPEIRVAALARRSPLRAARAMAPALLA